jgi:hypothetical protein
MLVNLKIQFEKFDTVDMAMEGLYSLDDAAADAEKLKGVYDGQMKLVRLNIQRILMKNSHSRQTIWYQ